MTIRNGKIIREWTRLYRIMERTAAENTEASNPTTVNPATLINLLKKMLPDFNNKDQQDTVDLFRGLMDKVTGNKIKAIHWYSILLFNCS